MIKRDNVKSASVNSPVVLGTFEGECADSNITNKNGLDITREVWEAVFDSDDYSEAIENGWYIGFLGHPEDPNCMDFEHACIVMTEGHIDDNGKIYGKFNLVDTPVGRIVKSFIDAGVTFGISVRGAGDIIDNSVDPDTFVFRGFDLVSFPAYPESVPTFTEIAASSDIEKQRKYKNVCAAVKENIEGLNSVESVKIVQSQFAKQSDEYKLLESRKDELCCSEEDEDEVLDQVNQQKIEGLTSLYLDELDKNRELAEANKQLSKDLVAVKSSTRRKLDSIRRITASQRNASSKHLKVIKASKNELVSKNQDILEKNRELKSQIRDLQAATKQLKVANLKYKSKITASAEIIENQKNTISNLKSDLNETVNKISDLEVRTSNLDASNRKLKSKINASQKLIEEYQDAYASLYANAVGANLDSIRITSSTSVSELQTSINGSVKLQNIQITDNTPTAVDLIDLSTGDQDLVIL